jgi:hypothetical protein
MSFRITGLPAERFAPLFQMSDAELAEAGAVRLHVHYAAPGCYAARVDRVQ